ncbi:MAG: alpha/beta fold hydrolase [Saprospirales bacterium]|nr:alpha/beta fold hydrolase [Saprospirales bacterium]
MKRFEITVKKDLKLKSTAGKPFALDLYTPAGAGSFPLLLFAHGFKGFKDWGHWHLLANEFASRGFAFLKFNFSHNGVTPKYPVDFADLEAFGQNNYTKELQDLDTLIHALFQRPEWLPASCDLDRLGLIGHSRGGALSILFAAREPRIKALATWAAVSDLGFLWRDKQVLEQWRQTGVHFISNARTRQQMPLYFQLYEDFQAHGEAYQVEPQLRRLQKPMLIVHGAADPGVPVAQAHQLKSWNPNAELAIIDGADHVFGGSHPFEGKELPAYAQILAEKTIAFFEKISQSPK